MLLKKKNRESCSHHKFLLYLCEDDVLVLAELLSDLLELIMLRLSSAISVCLLDLNTTSPVGHCFASGLLADACPSVGSET